MTLALSTTTANFLKLFTAPPVQREKPCIVAASDASGDGSDSSSPAESSLGVEDADDSVATSARVNRRDLADLEQDFDALMRRYQQPIFNLAVQLVSDEDEAGDITLETFLSAYKARSSFRSESKVFTWLYRIAINHSKNRRKAKTRLKSHEGPSLDSGFETEGEDTTGLLESGIVADWSQSPALLLEKGELREKIREAIDTLPHEYKSVLILREMEDMAYNDIAEATGLSLEAVKTRISRARGMVRRRVAPYYLQD